MFELNETHDLVIKYYFRGIDPVIICHEVIVTSDIARKIVLNEHPYAKYHDEAFKIVVHKRGKVVVVKGQHADSEQTS